MIKDSHQQRKKYHIDNDNHQLKSTNVYEDGRLMSRPNGFHQAQQSLDFAQDKQLSDSQTPQSCYQRITDAQMMQSHHMNIQAVSARRKARIQKSSDGTHFEMHLSQSQKEDDFESKPQYLQQSVELSHQGRNDAASNDQLMEYQGPPSGSGTKKGERSRSNFSNLSSRLKMSYPDEKCRDSTKMSKNDMPMRQTRDFSKALSIFSIKRDSTDDRTSSVMQPARVGSQRRGNGNRLFSKQLRLVSQSSESPINSQSLNIMKFNKTLQQSTEKSPQNLQSKEKGLQALIGQSSPLLHESFGQKTSNLAESTAQQRESVDQMPDLRPMIQIYNRQTKKTNNQKSSKKLSQTMKLENAQATDDRVSNIFFKSKNQQNTQINSLKESEQRIDSAFSMKQKEASPLINQRGYAPNITSSHGVKAKRGRKLSSNNSIETPEDMSRNS